MAPWSWAALGAWLARACLALAIAAGLLVGPQLADGAWDRGVHVTPAQAALHGALMANGFSHHHHAGVPMHQVAQEMGATLQRLGPGMTWGSPLAQAFDTSVTPCLALAGCSLLPADQGQPAGVAIAPANPPPESA